MYKSLKVVLSVLSVASVFVSVTVGVIVGLGFALHWLVPALELSACVFTVLGALILWGLLACVILVLSARDLERKRLETAEDSEEIPDDVLETHADMVADRLFSAISSRLDNGPRRRRR
jgi:hypothetical protein